jgi:hypothetical protein
LVIILRNGSPYLRGNVGIMPEFVYLGQRTAHAELLKFPGSAKIHYGTIL